MEFISFTSVITNAAIIAFSSLWIKKNLFVKYLNAHKDEELLAAQLGFILVFEHVVFLFKIILRAAIPNVSLTIKLAVQRSKCMSRVANEGLDSEMDEDYYEDEDIDSLSQPDETESEEGGADDETLSRAGSSVRRPSDQTQLGAISTMGLLSGSGVHGQGSTGDKTTRRPELGLNRSWSSRVLNFGGGLRSNDSGAALSAAMAGALPKIHEIPPSIRSSSVAGTGLVSGSGSRWQASEEYHEKVPAADGRGVGLALQQQQQQQQQWQQRPQQDIVQHRSPLAQLLVVGIDRPLHPSQSLGGQRRPPVPKRPNTEMDGEWVVIEEKGV
ncbi:hypothetical protein BGW39_004136 [Mortierella sp. 14UC]|nr:hypothetical protein BGW39_004136 [Mortierella sp. 14UC]